MDPVLDGNELMQRVGDDVGLLAQLADLYRRRSVEIITELQKRVQGSDAAAIAQSAHQLRGMLANMSGKQATALAATLEDQAKRNALQDPVGQAAAIAQAVTTFGQALEAFLKTLPAP